MIKKEYYKNKTEICDEIWERIKMLIEKKIFLRQNFKDCVRLMDIK